MRAWRSDSRARTASSLRSPRCFYLLALLAVLIPASWHVGAAFAAVAAKPAAPVIRKVARPAADTTRDESGFKVRVVEESKGKRATRIPAVPVPGESGVPDAVPEPPDMPDVPDKPDSLQVDSDSNDLVRFGEDITIPAGKVVEGDVVAIGGDVTVLGRVKGDVLSVGGAVEVRGGGAVEGDAVSLGGGVTTSDSASVAGSNVSIGTMRFWHGAGMLPMLGKADGPDQWLATTVLKLALTLFFAWIALLLWKDGILRASSKLHEQFGKSFLWGLLTMAGLVVAIPVGIIALVLLCVIAVVILCITIIGIPVALLLIIALVLAIVGLIVGVIFAVFLGYLNGAHYLGRRILGARSDRYASPLWAIAVGMAVVLVLGLLGHLAAFVGMIIFHPFSIAFGIAARALSFILTVAGLGAVWLSFVQGGGLSWSSYNWGPRRAKPEPHAGAPGAGARAEDRPPTPPGSGSSDAP
jgi:hypothetical protein